MGTVYSGPLSGIIDTRLANCMVLEEEEREDRCHLEAILKAGGYDDLSSVCLGNAAVALWYFRD